MALSIIVGTRFDRGQVRMLDRVRGRTGRAAAVRELTMSAISMRHEFSPHKHWTGADGKPTEHCIHCKQPSDSLIHLTYRELDTLARADHIARDMTRFDSEELHADG